MTETGVISYEQFLNRIIEDGIKAAKADYTTIGNKDKLDGSLLGFEQCRGKNLEELADLLASSHAVERAVSSITGSSPFLRCQVLEIEWVCNCVSAMLMNQKLPTIIEPTCRGVIKAAEVLGVKEK